MGYFFTSAQVAEQLATLGTLCGLDGPLPFLDLLCLLVGAVILINSYQYITYSASINSQVRIWYGADIDPYLEDTVMSTGNLLRYRMSGIRYWQAFLVNYKGMGGIALGGPLDTVMAVAVVNANTPLENVYAVYRTDAMQLAQSVPFVYFTMPVVGTVREDAHTMTQQGEQPLNLPHYHVLYRDPMTPTKDTHGKTHMFYTW